MIGSFHDGSLSISTRICQFYGVPPVVWDTIATLSVSVCQIVQAFSALTILILNVTVSSLAFTTMCGQEDRKEQNYKKKNLGFFIIIFILKSFDLPKVLWWPFFLFWASKMQQYPSCCFRFDWIIKCYYLNLKKTCLLKKLLVLTFSVISTLREFQNTTDDQIAWGSFIKRSYVKSNESTQRIRGNLETANRRSLITSFNQ